MNGGLKVTERMVATLLMGHRYHRDFCLPNYTPDGWWENDVMVITKADFWYEYEIKLTLADFKKDSEKSQRVHGSGKLTVDPEGRRRWVYEQKNKHAVLAEFSEEGPSYFYYVVPAGLVAKEMVPSWAGLIEFEEVRGKLFEVGTLVKAPRRHAKKRPDIRTQALGNCYWRYHKIRAQRR